MTNADMYTTPNEMSDAFSKFCSGFEECEDCPLFEKCACSGVEGTFLWLEMEYRGE